MNRADIIQRLERLDFDRAGYWLVAGGAMVLYGLRQETGDIDLGCGKKLADELEKQGHQVTYMSDGTRKIRLEADIELFENWLYDRVEYLEGIPVISLRGLLAMKRALGREKDKADIRKIEDFISVNSCVQRRFALEDGLGPFRKQERRQLE